MKKLKSRTKKTSGSFSFFAYIFIPFAKDKDMENVYVFGAFINMLLLFFPIFLSLDIYTDIKDNKIYFALYHFKFLKFFGGYIVLHKDGIAIHITEKKAFFVKYSDMKNERKKFEITAGFQLYTLRTSLELGDEDYPTAGLYVAIITQIISQTVYPFFTNRKNFLNLKNGTLLLRGGQGVKATLHLVTVFNQLTVIIAVIKIILEAIINLWQKKKNTKRLKV